MGLDRLYVLQVNLCSFKEVSVLECCHLFSVGMPDHVLGISCFPFILFFLFPSKVNTQGTTCVQLSQLCSLYCDTTLVKSLRKLYNCFNCTFPTGFLLQRVRSQNLSCCAELKHTATHHKHTTTHHTESTVDRIGL